MFEPYVDWPQVASALSALPAPFQVTLSDLVKAGRQPGSGLKHVRHNGRRSGRILWRRDLICSFFANRWRNAPEVHAKFSAALRKFTPEMR